MQSARLAKRASRSNTFAVTKRSWPTIVAPASLDGCHLYTGRLAESYFWRTCDRQEIDLVEEWGGRLYAAEMKWSPRSAARAPGGWRQACPDSAFRTVHRENYLDFITASAS